MDEAAAERGTASEGEPHLGIENYYEQGMRVVGAYVDGQHARDLFFLEQEGSFVLRMLVASSTKAIGHRLGRIHERRDSGYDRGRTTATRQCAGSGRREIHWGGPVMKALKVLFISIGALLAAMVIIPLTILAGLFVWLKLTEEGDEGDLELEDTV